MQIIDATAFCEIKFSQAHNKHVELYVLCYLFVVFWIKQSFRLDHENAECKLTDKITKKSAILSFQQTEQRGAFSIKERKADSRISQCWRLQELHILSNNSLGR